SSAWAASTWTPWPRRSPTSSTSGSRADRFEAEAPRFTPGGFWAPWGHGEENPRPVRGQRRGSHGWLRSLRAGGHQVPVGSSSRVRGSQAGAGQEGALVQTFGSEAAAWADPETGSRLRQGQVVRHLRSGWPGPRG